MEGTKNDAEWGSHDKAHSNLEVGMDKYRQNRQLDKKIPISFHMKKSSKLCIDAVRESAAKNCDSKCLQAQLDYHYKQCKDLEAEASDESDAEKLEPNAGTGRLPTLPKKVTDDNFEG
ncbi:hypothetical protein [Gilvimarinus japonicus]|uniref:Uncharacterized protein n=1 Tax=Gilvimarinus japonicus TaxID=1796469 RepID=A0ABV7HTF7_9GAMM